jgi:hypothetical protein|tara:strand:+ start:5370 stop:5603 length:234 start_codon:yes stop_codon:yes gene_type:complete
MVWKKTRMGPQGIRWENKRTGKVAFVHTLKKRRGFKTDVIATEFQDWNKPRNKGRFTSRDFKTKAQAVSFARKHMRK